MSMITGGGIPFKQANAKFKSIVYHLQYSKQIAGYCSGCSFNVKNGVDGCSSSGHNIMYCPECSFSGSEWGR